MNLYKAIAKQKHKTLWNRKQEVYFNIVSSDIYSAEKALKKELAKRGLRMLLIKPTNNNLIIDV